MLIMAAGPIVNGQAYEFDYSGTPVCKAFKLAEAHYATKCGGDSDR